MAFRLRSIHYVVKWIIAVFILYPPHVTSQSQHTTFTSVAPEELSDSFVRCFLKDSKGYMWFGTNEGLVRYDGIKTYWYVHDPTDNKTIANNSINVIIEDANQKLWIGTAQGLNSYDRETDSFTNVDSISGNKNNLKIPYENNIRYGRNYKLTINWETQEVTVYRYEDDLKETYSKNTFIKVE